MTNPAGVKALVLGRGSAPSKAGAGGAAQGAGQGAGEGADETGELALNGLLLSACSENETASAATSATDGMSAFTCALMGVLDAAQGELSVAELHEQTRAKLQELGFRQTPLLKAPNEPADLASMGFVTLAPAGGEAEQGQEQSRANQRRAKERRAKSAGPKSAGQVRHRARYQARARHQARDQACARNPACICRNPAGADDQACACDEACTHDQACTRCRSGGSRGGPACNVISRRGASPNGAGIAPGEPRPTPPREQRQHHRASSALHRRATEARPPTPMKERNPP